MYFESLKIVRLLRADFLSCTFAYIVSYILTSPMIYHGFKCFQFTLISLNKSCLLKSETFFCRKNQKKIIIREEFSIRFRRIIKIHTIKYLFNRNKIIYLYRKKFPLYFLNLIQKSIIAGYAFSFLFHTLFACFVIFCLPRIFLYIKLTLTFSLMKTKMKNYKYCYLL